MNEDTRKTVQLLAEHELALKELYETYATLLPSRKDLWLNLAQDEQRHAHWLDSLLAAAGPADAPGSCLWPRRAAIETSLKYVRGQIVRARQAKVTLVIALSVAKDLESALLEKEFFKVADSTRAETRAVLNRLTAATEIHWRTVSEALDQAKRTPADAQRA